MAHKYSPGQSVYYQAQFGKNSSRSPTRSSAGCRSKTTADCLIASSALRNLSRELPRSTNFSALT